MAGFLIEFIESQRGKLKEKRKVGLLLGILLRINDLRTQVVIEFLREQQSKVVPNFQLLSKMKEIYKGIRNDLSDFFKENAESPILPSLSSASLFSKGNLQELNVCLGQLQGLVLGRLYEFVFLRDRKFIAEVKGSIRIMRSTFNAE